MTKFLNISTDTTLGGNSPSDDTVSSQKAIKAYVDSQTGTAPAFANITGQPSDNVNLAAAFNGKADIDLGNCTKPHVVETYVNGQSGYRVWSDGYCEQWGNYITNGVATWFTVNFSKVFANVNYNISTTPVRANANLIPVAIPVQVSVSNMQVACGDATGSFYWFVCGYIS